MNGDLGTTRQEIERSIQGLPYEVAAAFNSVGILLFAPRVGGPNHVEFTEAEIRAFSDIDGVLTHNHPREVVLSGVDIDLAVRTNLAELRAVCPSGTVYVAKRPRNGWPSQMKAENGCRRAYNEAQYRVLEEISKRNPRSKPMQNEVDLLWADAYEQAMARELLKLRIKIEREKL